MTSDVNNPLAPFGQAEFERFVSQVRITCRVCRVSATSRRIRYRRTVSRTSRMRG